MVGAAWHLPLIALPFDAVAFCDRMELAVEDPLAVRDPKLITACAVAGMQSPPENEAPQCGYGIPFSHELRAE